MSIIFKPHFGSSDSMLTCCKILETFKTITYRKNTKIHIQWILTTRHRGFSVTQPRRLLIMLHKVTGLQLNEGDSSRAQEEEVATSRFGLISQKQAKETNFDISFLSGILQKRNISSRTNFVKMVDTFWFLVEIAERTNSGLLLLNKKRQVSTSQSWAFRSESVKGFQLHFHRCDSCNII